MLCKYFGSARKGVVCVVCYREVVHGGVLLALNLVDLPVAVLQGLYMFA